MDSSDPPDKVEPALPPGWPDAPAPGADEVVDEGATVIGGSASALGAAAGNADLAARPLRTGMSRTPEDHDTSSLPAGTQLHEFVIERALGEGGFGVVYLARDTLLERTVAIKEYMPTTLAMRRRDLAVTLRADRHRETFEMGLRSFLNEARLLASFDHASLVKVYRFWEANGTAYMVMPYYQGPTLKTWLLRNGPPDETWLKRLLAPLLDALETIHRDRCYHRDIAPDNILLLGPDRPVLLDFGAARRVISDATQALTVILKPGYAPIEQYAEVATMKQGPWTDVYALCAVVYACICAESPPPAVARIVSDEIVSATVRGAGRYSEGFLAAIDAGLGVKPEERPQSIAALRTMIFGDAPMPVHPSAPAYGPTSQALSPLRTGMTGGSVDAAADAAAAAALQMSATRNRPDDSAWHDLADEAVGERPDAPAVPAPVERPARAAVPARPRMAMAGMALAVVAGALWWWQSGRVPASTEVAAGGSDAASAAVTPMASASAAASSARRDPLARLADDAAESASSSAAPAVATKPAAAASPAVTAGAPAAVAGAASVDAAAVPAVRPPFSIGAMFEDVMRRAEPRIDVALTSERSQLVIGRDRFQFRLRASEPGYVYVLLAGTDSAHFNLLFPNSIDKNNRIDGKGELLLPRQGWHITAAGPPGVNRLVAVVSRVPRDFGATGLLKASDEPIPEFDMSRAPALWRSAPEGANPFIGRPKCPTNSTAVCDGSYGAAVLTLEEIAPR